MVDVGDIAPEISAPVATGDVESFTLTDRLEEEASIVLAFFPAAFTSTCATELSTFEDRLGRFDDLEATVYGVSVDSPFALNEFRSQQGLSFDLISDFEKELIDAYDVRTDFATIDVYGLAKRAVFVVDADGVVTYTWVSDDAGVEPDYDAVEEAVVKA
ncbi:redoxin domain-containing protein [Natronosalvus vescus]|uniref:redoxin domain-containing protein n=1 Tax=Natronosalvus vescus TaxID=2953881 RepID=UPI002090C74E|nr:redoxin domain-containing protein [Natronosalvus vescus]